MAGSFLLDTNAIIALLAQDPSLHTLLAGSQAYVPAVALGEMYITALSSRDKPNQTCGGSKTS